MTLRFYADERRVPKIVQEALWRAHPAVLATFDTRKTAVVKPGSIPALEPRSAKSLVAIVERTVGVDQLPQ
jgi:hypothetical protein